MNNLKIIKEYNKASSEKTTWIYTTSLKANKKVNYKR